MVLQYTILAIAAAVVSAGLAAVTYYKSARKDLALRFAALTIAITIIALGDGLRKYYGGVFDDYDLALFWTKVAILGGILFIPAFAEFCSVFPPRIETQRLMMLIASTAVAAFLFGLLITDTLVRGLIKTPIGYSTHFGPGIFIFAPSYAVIVGLSIISLVKKTWRRAPYYKLYFSLLALILSVGGVVTLVPPIQEALYEPPSTMFIVAIAGVFSVLVMKQKFMIVPLAENSLVTPLREKLKEGRTYLYYSDNVDKVFKIFVDYVNHGYAGMCIARIHPSRIREEYKLVNTLILWMSEMNVENTLHPKDLESMAFYIKSFCEMGEKKIVFVQGLEYLVAQNGIKRILRFIQRVNDYATETRAIIILSMAGYRLSKEEQSLIQTEVTIVS